MTERQLIANIWRTPAGNILQSKHQHDFVSDAEGFFIDGGLSGYTRFGGGRFDEWEDLSVYTDSPHELIREHFVWKSYGKHGEIPEGVYTVLEMLTEDHIKAIIETQTHLPEYIVQVFRDELQYRKGTPMLTVQDFLDAGYRKYNQHTHNNSDYLLQKRVADEVGTKYFIHMWVYEHFNKEYYSRNPSLHPVSFMPEVQFQRGDEDTMEVTLILNDKSSIHKIEQEFECLWLFLEKPYYSTY